MYTIKGFGALVGLFLSLSPTGLSEVKKEYIIPPFKHQQFLDFLIENESGGDPNAVNPMDLDGTPSFGCLQFKPGTLYQFAHLEYKILPDIEEDEIKNVIFDCDLQIKTAKLMILDPHVDLHQQWPAVYRMWLREGHPLIR